ncbi:hypothetical protein J4429_03150 [Candidatus Pacearchaeota archaeon]|nr:hypothetical protein [Candidatus Pacearchaeota archaeon]
MVAQNNKNLLARPSANIFFRLGNGNIGKSHLIKFLQEKTKKLKGGNP